MKICDKCKQSKEEKEFANCKRYDDGIDYWCKICRNQYNREHRKSNLQKSRNFINDRRASRVDWVQSIKANKPCIDCGKIYEPFCMDYDHIKENKIKSVSRMVLDNTPKHIILTEIDKCELVCCLCHNIRTQKRFDKNLIKKYTKYTLRNIEIINNAKLQPCYICGISRDLCNMQMDHIDSSTKYKAVCYLKNFKTETLLKEIEKCRPICALCHRIKSITDQKEKWKKCELQDISSQKQC